MLAMAASQEHLACPGASTGQRRKPLGAVHAVSLGLLLTVLQVLAACLLSGRSNLHDAYLSLCQWDTVWYYSIVEAGYNNVPNAQGEANVAFFPGYPCVARQVRALTGLSSWEALLLTAQLSCWAFWTYLLLLLSRWGVPWRIALAAALCVLAYPAAFYLVAGYSESLFLACTLGFLYWSERSGRVAAVMAAVHGFGMTATRLVGLPLAIYPVARVLLGAAPGSGHTLRERLRRCTLPLLIGILTGGGALSYFLFCQYRFGCWNLYMLVEHAGWGVTPRYMALFSRRVIRLRVPLPTDQAIPSDLFSRLSVIGFLLTFGLLTVVESWLRWRQGPSGWRQRACLYVCAFFLLYVPVTAHATRYMSSMIRFGLCVQVLLALALGHLLTRAQPDSTPGRLTRVLSGLSIPVLLACQLFLLHRYTHGGWVA